VQQPITGQQAPREAFTGCCNHWRH